VRTLILVLALVSCDQGRHEKVDMQFYFCTKKGSEPPLKYPRECRLNSCPSAVDPVNSCFTTYEAWCFGEDDCYPTEVECREAKQLHDLVERPPSLALRPGCSRRAAVPR
jgi:hypothetical protein